MRVSTTLQCRNAKEASRKKNEFETNLLCLKLAHKIINTRTMFGMLAVHVDNIHHTMLFFSFFLSLSLSLFVCFSFDSISARTLNNLQSHTKREREIERKRTDGKSDRTNDIRGRQTSENVYLFRSAYTRKIQS